MSKAFLDIDIGDAEKYADEVAGSIRANTAFMFFDFTPGCLAPVHCNRSTCITLSHAFEDSGRMGASVQVSEWKWLKLRTVGCFAFRPRRCWQRTSSRGVHTDIFFRAVTCDVYIFVCCIHVRLPLSVYVLA